jgi:hypothetical protein
MFTLRKIKNYLLLLAASLLGLTVGLTSCINDDEVSDAMEQKDESQAYGVSFLLDARTGTSTSRTRTIVPTSEAGEGYENYIDPNRLKVWLNNGSGNYDSIVIDTLSIMNVEELEDGLYRVNGTFDTIAMAKSGSDTYFRLFATAACEDVPTIPYTESKIALFLVTRGLYHYDYGTAEHPTFFPSKTENITMSAVQRFKNVELRRGYSVDLGTLKMERAMAKIEVYTTDETKRNTVITGAKMTRCYNKGIAWGYRKFGENDAADNIMINETTGQTYDKQTGSGGLEGTLSYMNIPGEDNRFLGGKPDVLYDLPFTRVEGNFTDGDGNPYKYKYVFYMPEYRNTGNSPNSAVQVIPTQIVLTMKDDDVETDCLFNIDFKYYNEANTPAFNILRNVIYRYDVSINEKDIFLRYNVVNWDDETSGPITFE